MPRPMGRRVEPDARARHDHFHTSKVAAINLPRLRVRLNALSIMAAVDNPVDVERPLLSERTSAPFPPRSPYRNLTSTGLVRQTLEKLKESEAGA